MATTYHDCWDNYAAVLADYPKLPPEAQLVYAGYTYEDYSGDALVVWRDDDGKWWENNDCHCSCFGLERWEPEKTLPEALLMRGGWPGLHEAINARLADVSR